MKYKRSVENIKTPLCEAKLNKTDLPRHSYSFDLSLFEFNESFDNVEVYVILSGASGLSDTSGLMAADYTLNIALIILILT